MSEPDNHSHCHTSFKNMEKCERIRGGMAKTPVSTLSFVQPPLTESKRRFSGASHKFRNLITCGATDTNDAVLVMIDRVEMKISLRQDFNIERSSQICRVDRLGGSRRTSNTSWSTGKGRQEPHCHPRKSFDGVKGWKRSKKQKNACEGDGILDAYKPTSMPSCSQCGKPFKPEKMHKHMKSCKGKRVLSERAIVKAPCLHYENATLRSRIHLQAAAYIGLQKINLYYVQLAYKSTS
ncbi:uncharacterized protein LOC130135786 [Syzygium oleosum]|uniref:uncharacterized protein LOC130135786 n=1 Tax=Syzygium oleosum TaxID=219896 RepID=UPI0024B8D37E|nr:uncharacterized protein LOC130135786 [Syzygium oleosum]